MKSPFLIVGFAGFYLYLVNYLKRFMKQREPYDIKHVMLLYNGLQIVFNSYIFYYVSKTTKIGMFYYFLYF